MGLETIVGHQRIERDPGLEMIAESEAFEVLADEGPGNHQRYRAAWHVHGSNALEFQFPAAMIQQIHGSRHHHRNRQLGIEFLHQGHACF